MRFIPSRMRAYFNNSCITESSVFFNHCNSATSSNAWSIVKTRPNFEGIHFVILSTCGIGILRTRATSRITAFEERRLNVIIWQTDFSPYFSFTYSITSPRWLSAKSTSISGMDLRAGFKNLSNNKLYFNGSTLVIPSAYATKLPAALPRPGPTGIPRDFDALIKS